MRFLLLFSVLLAAGALPAQAPTVVVTHGGTVVPNAGGFDVDQFSSFNSAGISLTVDDPQGDPVGISAVVSNVGAALNWDETTFEKAPTATPYIFNVMSTNGEFGPKNTVHVVTLDLVDGMNVTQFSFTISVVDPNAGSGGSANPGGPGGACAAGTAGAPFCIAMLGALLYRRRSRAKLRPLLRESGLECLREYQADTRHQKWFVRGRR